MRRLLKAFSTDKIAVICSTSWRRVGIDVTRYFISENKLRFRKLSYKIEKYISSIFYSLDDNGQFPIKRWRYIKDDKMLKLIM